MFGTILTRKRQKKGAAVTVAGVFAYLALVACGGTATGPIAGDMATDVHQTTEDSYCTGPGGLVKRIVLRFWNDSPKKDHAVTVFWNVDPMPRGTSEKKVYATTLVKKLGGKGYNVDNFQPDRNDGNLIVVKDNGDVVKKGVHRVTTDEAKSLDFTDAGLATHLEEFQPGRNWAVVTKDIPANKPGAKGKARNRINLHIASAGSDALNAKFNNDCTGGNSGGNTGGGSNGGAGKAGPWTGTTKDFSAKLSGHCPGPYKLTVTNTSNASHSFRVRVNQTRTKYSGSLAGGKSVTYDVQANATWVVLGEGTHTADITPKC